MCLIFFVLGSNAAVLSTTVRLLLQGGHQLSHHLKVFSCGKFMLIDI